MEEFDDKEEETDEAVGDEAVGLDGDEMPKEEEEEDFGLGED